MIYFDVTKTASSRHHSGLMRVSTRLREELGTAASPVRWEKGQWVDGEGVATVMCAEDWLLTPELFCEQERPGFWRFLRERTCRAAAIFHDAIPLKHPHITWPQSVARHPEYLKMLADFDHVFAVSKSSGRDLEGFWSWLGVAPRGCVSSLQLGADMRGGRPRPTAREEAAGEGPLLLCVGIVEPRKNQAFVADVVEELGREGLRFRCDFVGRVNPHFGAPIAARLKQLAKRQRGVRFHEALPDESLLALWRDADVTLFATIAEGCGLPLLESLWFGVPCVYSDLPVLRENGEGGGCVPAGLNDRESWLRVLRRLLGDVGFRACLKAEANARELPTWRQAAEQLIRAL